MPVRAVLPLPFVLFVYTLGVTQRVPTRLERVLANLGKKIPGYSRVSTVILDGYPSTRLTSGYPFNRRVPAIKPGTRLKAGYPRHCFSSCWSIKFATN